MDYGSCSNDNSTYSNLQELSGSSFVQMEEVDGSYSVAFKEEVNVFIFLVKCCSGVFVPEKEWRPTSVWVFLSREGNFAMTVGLDFLFGLK
ncbi:hypothetical protein MRB53_009118 [Persea americana]|uniref:Uncharacterized protein n=1 Tax=Persea americana TaxID=3435 RepID=A0ACC2LPA4_PERAE|nr:hypothetical protein MRB53_009118 [Persea americana]